MILSPEQFVCLCPLESDCSLLLLLFFFFQIVNTPACHILCFLRGNVNIPSDRKAVCFKLLKPHTTQSQPTDLPVYDITHFRKGIGLHSIPITQLSLLSVLISSKMKGKKESRRYVPLPILVEMFLLCEFLCMVKNWYNKMYRFLLQPVLFDRFVHIPTIKDRRYLRCCLFTHRLASYR